MEKLSKEIASSIKSAVKKEMTAVFRPNLTSDLTWENIEDANGQTLMQKFSRHYNFMIIPSHYMRMAQFISKQKMNVPTDAKRFSRATHLTFSAFRA